MERELYEDVVSRLAQMEKLVEELQTSKPEQEASATVSPRPSATPSSVQQSPLPRRKASSTSPSSGNPDSCPSPPSATSSIKSRPYYIGAADDTSVIAAGASSLLSTQGLAQIELLIGDARFTNALLSLRTKVVDLHRKPFLSLADLNHPLPPDHVIIDYVNEFLATWNVSIRLFQDHELRDALRSHTQGQPPDDPGWLMALNAIIAHVIRNRNCMRNKEEYQKYIHNALGMVPNIILRTPTPMTIGALLLTVKYFNFTSENHISMSLMGLTVQLLMMAGYHRLENYPSHPDLQIDPVNRLHRRRLFWRAYIIDHDLMLRMGKPPLIGDDFLLDLPEEHPADGYGMYYYPDGVTLNFFRQQVRLAQIQGHIAAALYHRIDAPPAELEAEIRRLDAELQEWRESIPPMIRAENAEALLDGDYYRMLGLTVLHFTYFQLIVAIHSAAFRLPSLGDQEGTETIDIGPSLALCVSASRASISLLNYHQIEHVFTPYLLYQVAWSVDILFVNIIQNRTNPRAHRDLELIRNVIGFFEKYDPLHQSVIAYHTIKVIADVAASVLANTPTLPPHMLPAPLGPSPIPEQPQQAAPLTAGIPVDAFSSPMGGAGLVGSGGINSGTTDMLRSMTTLSMSGTPPPPPPPPQQQQQQGFMGIVGGPTQPDETQFFPGFVNMAADWRLPMDFQPELWQYDSVLNNQFPNQSLE
ncbi:fungal specific transcription factor domain-containing protein [Colletotrichum graminicola M1.001]|uniref:Fungal specific transcription factor domain-containing protein n=1 Tax=Colletotrichum graminicola (strain M1.001 / M2 / FGSC 10212) TaxID=645133 RepID=E3Q482_COLGM|nr:fungal specific transcription factor domain-containing protein [Colletotrichum graminicola M1.001]EFQ25394.1 fungal specific transcription factor domain-containing protein [Colletotrichum graminicola M1.001]